MRGEALEEEYHDEESRGDEEGRVSRTGCHGRALGATDERPKSE